MVKLRYAEPPMFLDVAQVVTSYTFEGSGSINAPDWEGLRIPGEMGHWFRLKWGSHSDRSGALIPAGSGALFG